MEQPDNQGASDVAAVQRWTGVQTKALRLAMRTSSRQFAQRLGVDLRTVAKWEARGASITLLPNTQAMLDTLLSRADEQELARFETILQAVATADQPTTAPSVLNTLGDDGVDAVSGSTIIAVLGPTTTLSALNDFTRSVVARYELEGPRRLAPEVFGLRDLTRQLGGYRLGADDRVQLARVSARHAALLAYMAVNLSRYEDAERYALEAAVLATATDDQPLLAWIKGTQSFAAYYQQRYDDALNLAYAGLHVAGSDGQRIRLLANGVARAAGKLGDCQVVDQAVGDALELVAGQDGPTGMTPCIDFEPYGWARTAANAATAYLSVGAYGRALELTQQLSAVVASSDSDWSRSLVRLDEASALTLGRQADLEHAASVGVAALEASATKPIASVRSRAGELAASLQRRDPGKIGANFAAALHDWQQRVPQDMP